MFKLVNKHKLLIASLLALIPLYFIVLNFYLNRLGAFGCFDDCNNFVRGYFVLKGKILFSEVFSGHMPLMSYLSTVIQKFTSPDSIYHLLLYHTLFLFILTILSGVILIFRFKWVGLAFVLLYESFNIYLFGDRFLAEGVIVYPIVYLAGLFWEKIQKRKIYKMEYALTGVIAWLVVFMREPYIPLILFLFFLILWGEDHRREKIISIAIFLSLTFMFVLIHPINEFIFNVFTMNFQNISTEFNETGTRGLGFFKIFLYPFVVLFKAKWNDVWLVINVLVFILIILSAKFFRVKKTSIFVIFLILSLASIRFVEPGTVFYSAYHILIWYGLLIMFVFLLLRDIDSEKLRKLFLFILGMSFFITLFPPNILWEKTDTIKEINDGYANYSINARIIRVLADKNSTLFIDGGDDLIYWRADLKPAYKYSWYTSLMPYFKIYTDARIEMFKKYSPDFYYGNCRKGYFLPDFVKDSYQNIKKLNGDKSCLYVKKDIVQQISEDKIREINKLEYKL